MELILIFERFSVAEFLSIFLSHDHLMMVPYNNNMKAKAYIHELKLNRSIEEKATPKEQKLIHEYVSKFTHRIAGLTYSRLGKETVLYLQNIMIADYEQRIKSNPNLSKVAKYLAVEKIRFLAKGYKDTAVRHRKIEKDRIKKLDSDMNRYHQLMVHALRIENSDESKKLFQLAKQQKFNLWKERNSIRIL